ncbi:prion-inhibition and propagation-domain-containing protein [Halenospora varia]|nr:prion-inhibition and propagation-domain-containing protein [Halenospora varia]
MAEIFGIVAGAAGLASAFVPCIECFEFIQLGRNFGKDYQTCQLKLDVAALRLSRWGLAVGLGNLPNAEGTIVQPEVVATARELKILARILEDMFNNIEEWRKRSERFEAKAQRDEANNSQYSGLKLYDPEKELEGGSRFLHRTITGIVTRRHRKDDNPVGFWRKTKWALYEKNVFDLLIADITKDMDCLESVFPAVKKALAETSKAELGTISKNDDLKLLASVAGSSDKVLVEAVTKSLAEKGDTWTNFEIETEETGHVQIGNDFGLGREAKSASTFDTFKIGGKGFTQVGHTFRSDN